MPPRPFTATNVPGLTSTAAAQPADPPPVPDPYAEGYDKGYADGFTVARTAAAAWFSAAAAVLATHEDPSAGRVHELAAAFSSGESPADAVGPSSAARYVLGILRAVREPKTQE